MISLIIIIIIKFFLYRGGNVNGTFKYFPSDFSYLSLLYMYML